MGWGDPLLTGVLLAALAALGSLLLIAGLVSWMMRGHRDRLAERAHGGYVEVRPLGGVRSRPRPRPRNPDDR